MGKPFALIPRLLNEDQAAAYLGRSRNAFRAQLARGELPQPSDRNGNRNLWDRQLLDRHVDLLSGIGDAENPWDSL